MKETILEKIIKDKKDWIKFRKNKQPFITFKNNINKETRDFYSSLKEKNPVFILECKKQSPSLGVIRNNFDLIQISKIYKKYASSISVLTDEKYFDGKFEFIPVVRKHTSQPILCKDFFIDPYQIYLARYYKADAILLMLSVLNDSQYETLSKIAKKLNMGVLTEINNIVELKRAIQLNADIVGINNRNLHDLSIDLNRTRKLSSLLPKNMTIISESGIKKYSQVRELSKFVNGFLIGSHLMSKENLDISIRSLIFGKNKVCGLTRSYDAEIIGKEGAVYGGLIFVKNSLRNINEKISKKIVINNLLRYVGVFQNEDINIIVNIAETLSLYAIQLHGKENLIYINTLRKILPKNIAIWKAFSINSKELPDLNWKNVNMYIFDSYCGGSNVSFDWSILKNHYFENVLLAGGINPDNCVKASELRFSGLDLNSGVEISPGIKDHKKIKSVFQKLRYY
ncbi:bifunctional indole-3-glycerol-phosphate synthase TrpC/phosphoribosylanthranilate isomerase TrpF [Buchnera aphidicola]|uniref:Multifunctional fusion protein n=1 Tax=Buchnera aphidicola (Lipaphis pseudobrassicae) TaxID=1258543 RepID=A0A4D6Y7I2_9GAMM|nr:bifunctional indole-3-glycerol-phosphate synthase TrpC/phosphoribosylanthranilate isomerase TrpF [Buchnera aphidicola]QCI22141.1 bifunctional indole-3-glycerol-phosphate synthase TrpC/phosphoribosylanthranilate isomerase TrpF [Buchnera aphidicola (Lipaphis pseudobrassicae)]